MSRPRRALVVVSSSTVLLLASCVSTGFSRQHELERIKLPPGFSIALYSDQVPGARAMTRSPKGTVFVGVGYEYWHNKYGNPPGVGTQVNAPQLQVEWHF